MSAHSAYLSSIFVSFSTFLSERGVVDRAAHDATLALAAVVEHKTDWANWDLKRIADFWQTPIGVQHSSGAQALVTAFIRRYPPTQINVFLHEFCLALAANGCSHSTVKNYRSDISQFAQFGAETELNKLITKPKVTEFLRQQRIAGLKHSSIRRKLVSIQQFANWAAAQDIFAQPQWFVELFSALENAQPLEVLDAATSRPKPAVLPKAAVPVVASVPVSASSNPGVDSITSTVPASPLIHQERTAQLQSVFSRVAHKHLRRPSFGSGNPGQWALTALVLLVTLVGIGFFGYQQLLLRVSTPLAYPTSPTRPNRQLSFQGRLTDTAQNPITTATDMRFYLYDSGPSTGSGSQLWDSGTCSVTPDQDGIFSVGLGDDCGTEITEDVFSENSNVWLEVEIEAETLDPRQAIQTVPYALNSETLQGYPITASGAAAVNTVVTMNSAGEVVLGEVSPSIRSVSGTFSLEAQTLSLETSSGSNGDIILSPDGTGEVQINADTVIDGYLYAPGATLSATYAGGTALVTRGGPSGTANIQEWQNSAGSALTVVDESGNVGIGTSNPSIFSLQVAGNIGPNTPDTYTIGSSANEFNEAWINTITTRLTTLNLQTSGSGHIRLDSAGGRVQIPNDSLGIGTDTPDRRVEILDASNPQLRLSHTDSSVYTDLQTTASGYLYLNPSGGRVGIGTSTPDQALDIVGNLKLSGTTTFNSLTYTWPASQSNGYVLSTNGSGTLSWSDPAVLAGGTNLWDSANGTLYPKNATLDLLIGGTATSSAKFAFINNNSGTPTATISGNLSLQIPTGSNPATTFNVLNGGSLNIRTATTGQGDAGLTSRVFVKNDGNVGIGSTTPNRKLVVDGQIQAQGLYSSDGNNNKFISTTGNIFTYSTYGSHTFKTYNGSTYSTALELTGGLGATDQNLLFTGNGNVGLGTTAPAQLLHANAGTTDSVATLRSSDDTAWFDLQDNDTTGVFLVKDSYLSLGGSSSLSANNLNINTTNGNIGINTLTPSQKLDVVGEIELANYLYFDNGTSEYLRWDGSDFILSDDLLPAADGASNLGSDAVRWDSLYVKGSSLHIGDSGNEAIIGYSTGSNYLGFDPDGDTTAEVVINDNGNIGIGSLSPAAALDVVGDVFVSSGISLFGTAVSDGLVEATTFCTGDGETNCISDFSTISAGSGIWATANGAIYPTNSTRDLLIGGTATSSAKFAFLNVDSGTPTASVSAGAAGGTYLTAGGKLATTALQNMTLGDSTTTGDVIINPSRNVGIGTTAATSKLTVNGGIMLTPTSGLIDFNSSAYRFGRNGNDFYWTVAGVERMRLRFDGNLGIGTSSPTQLLDVNGDIRVRGNDITDSGDTTRISLGATTTLTNTTTTLSGTTSLTASSLDTFTTGSSLTMGSTTTLTLGSNATLNGGAAANDDLTLQGTSNATRTSSYVLLQPTAGNVGIGSTTPGEKLDVVGNFKLSGTTTFNSLTYTWPASQSNGYVLSTNGSGTLSWTDPNTLITTGDDWDIANGALYPKNATLDLLIGGTATSSAKFAFINNNSGTPTATISGNLSLQVPTGSNPATTLNVLNGGALNIRTATTGQGDAGLNSRLYVANSGNIGINTTNPQNLLHIVSSTANKIQLNGSGIDASYIAYGAGSTTGWLVGKNTSGTFRIENAADTNIGLAITGTGLASINDPTPGANWQVDQASDGQTVFQSRRATDTSPTGDFLKLQNAGGSTIGSIDINANMGLGGAANSSYRLNLAQSGTTQTAQLMQNGQGSAELRINASGNFEINGLTAAKEVVFNQAGDNVDLRVEGDTNANLFFVDASADYIGIGTSSPGSKLQINGSGTGVKSLIVRGNSSNDADIQNWQNGSGTTLSVIDEAGWLGVGTTNPLAPLHIAASAGNSTTGSILSFFVSSYTGGSTQIANNFSVQIPDSAPSAYIGLRGNAQTGSGNPYSAAGLTGFSGNVLQQASSGTIVTATGGQMGVSTAGGGSITNAYGMNISAISNASTGSISNARGVNIASFSNTGGGSITTAYGLYVGSQTAAGNNYGIWGDAGDWILDEDGNGSAGGNSGGGDIFLGEGQDLELYHDGTNSYIMNNTGDLYIGDAATDDVILSNNGGNVGIGTTNPTYKLDVAGTGRYTGAVDLDADLELNSTLTDVNGSVGTSGQILSSTGTGVDWIDAPSAGYTSWVIADDDTDTYSVVDGNILRFTSSDSNILTNLTNGDDGDENMDFSIRLLGDAVAGAGLTGGADNVLVGADADVTFAIGAGDGITVNADDVAVNQAFNFAWTGTHSWSNSADFNGDVSIADTNIAFDGASTTFTTTGAFTLTPGGAVTLGDGGDTMAINTSDWDISTTGSLTGISGIANDGAYTQTGTSANTFTGAVTVSGILTANGTLDLNGTRLILDADADTSITADTDDQIDIEIAGADDFRFTANTFIALSGSTVNINSGATLDVNGDLAIADTNISLDGASTTFTQTTGAISLAPAAGANLNITLSGAGDFVVNTNDLVVDTSSGNIGIGSVTPAAALDVVGDIFLSSGLSTFGTAVSDGTIEATKFCTGDGETNCISDFSTIQPGGWTDDGTTVRLTTATDYVAIGAATAHGKVGIDGARVGQALLVLDEEGDQDIWTASASGTNVARLSRTGDLISKRFMDWSNTAYYLDAADSTTSLLTAGNVGIGTTNPQQLLHVDSGTTDSLATFRSSDDIARIDIRDNDTTGFLVAKDGYFSIGGTNTLSSANININTSSGNFGVGTTAPSALVDVVKGSSSASTGTTAQQISFTDNAGSTSLSGITNNALGVTHTISGSVAASRIQTINGANIALTNTSTVAGDQYVSGLRISNDYSGTPSGANQHDLYGLNVTTSGDMGLTSTTRYGGYFLTSGQANNNYGLYLNTSGATTDWGIYSTGEDKNYLSGNLGIGTTSPGGKLNTYDNTSGATVTTALRLDRINSSGAGTTGLGQSIDFFMENSSSSVIEVANIESVWNGTSDANLNFNVYSAGSLSTAMTIYNNGNIGIGTTDATQKLDVNGDLRVRGNDITDSGNTTRITIGNDIALTGSTISFSGITTIYGSFLTTFNTSSSLTMGATQTLTLGSNSTINGGSVANDDLTLQGTSNATRTSSYVLLQPTAGNVGIGTTAPAAALDIQGPMITDGSLSFQSILANNTTAYNSSPVAGQMFYNKYNSGGSYAGMGGISVGKENTTDGNYSSYLALHTRTNGSAIAERLRINSSGNVGIGSTNPAYKFDLVTDVANYAAKIFNDGNSTSRTGLIIQVGTDSGSGTNTAIRFNDGDGTQAGQITFTGTTMTYGSASDVRLKEKISDTRLGLAELMNIQVADYTFKSDTTQKRWTGFLAQQLYQYFPDAVAVPNNPEDQWNVDYGKVTPLIVKSIQEQQAQITAQQTLLATIANTQQNLSLNSAGEVTISQQNGEYVASATSTGARLTNVAGFADALAARVTAGLTTTRQLVVQQSAQIANLSATNITVAGQNLRDYIAGIVRQTVQEEDLISPVVGTEVALAPAETFSITTASGSAVASINAAGKTRLGELTVAGDATIAGTLSSARLTALGQLTAGSASISGELIATDITAQTITTATISAESVRLATLEGRMAELETVKAQTAELVTATVSGTLYANTIDGFDAKIAAAFEQPSLLEILLQKTGMQNTPTATESATPSNLAQLHETISEVGIDASSSADLNLTLADLELTDDDATLTASAAFINDYLKVNGSAYINNSLAVRKELFVGEGMHIADGTIEYTAAPDEAQILAIQPSGKGTLSLLAGLMELNENGQINITGNLAVAGDVKVEGSLLSNLLQPAEYGNPFQVQVAGIATESGQVKESRFEIINELGAPVATISAQGRAAFAGGIGIGSESLDAPESEENTVTARKTSGKAAIAANTKEVTIKSELLTGDSLIYVTPVGSTENKVLYVKSQTAENPDTSDKEGRFVVGFDEQVSQEVQFNWWVVN